LPKLALLAGALVVVCCLVPAVATAKSAPTKLTIEPFPGGVSGYVKSPSTKTCSSDRKVVVYQQLGEAPDPGSDPRIASDLAEVSESNYMWTAKTGKTGQFYAGAAATKSCAAALSGSVESQTPAFELQSTQASYPPCGPYVSEGTSEICRFGQLYMHLGPEGSFDPCRFGPSSGNCTGKGHDAPFPWGVNYFGGPEVRTRLFWKAEDGARSLTMATYSGQSWGGDAAAYLGGHIPDSSSDRYTITDAYAQNEAGYPNGDHFYTPDLPGQAPGEVGGPLKLNFKNGSGDDFGAQSWVSGYLYLKR
jgi:hypothetical protein